MITYIAYDPITNIEGIITNFSSEELNALAESGMEFFACDGMGNREAVSVEEIDDTKCYESHLFPVITYKLWQEVMEPLSEMMSASMKPATALLPTSVAQKVETPYERFKAALKKIDDIFQEEA